MWILCVVESMVDEGGRAVKCKTVSKIAVAKRRGSRVGMYCRVLGSVDNYY
jgi:hypothetical protein